MMTCTVARMISTSASILGALTSVNANKTCTSLMENAEVNNYYLERDTLSPLKQKNINAIHI